MLNKILVPNAIKPPHDPDVESKVIALAEEMKLRGWQGRPLVVLPQIRRRYQALTGSHRYEAAKRAGIKIPVAIVDEEVAKLIYKHWANPTPEIYGDFRTFYKNGTPCFIPQILALICKDYPAVFNLFNEEVNKAIF